MKKSIGNYFLDNLLMKMYNTTMNTNNLHIELNRLYRNTPYEFLLTYIPQNGIVVGKSIMPEGFTLDTKLSYNNYNWSPFSDRPYTELVVR